MIHAENIFWSIMKMWKLCLIILLVTANLSAGLLDYQNSQENVSVEVNNRILANVNGKPITVVDVMKKMDMIFYKQFPEYASSKSARYQFYQINWKRVLEDVINKELILADAEEMKVEISNGDVRKEMELMFGPNIIMNLDKIGMSMDEARQIIKGDLILQRMMYARVNTRALRQVNPKELKLAYDKHAKENMQPDEWKYRVISIRDKEVAKGSEAAEKIDHIVKNHQGTFDALVTKIKELGLDATTKVNISEELKHKEEQISSSYKEVLSGMASSSFSEPIAQKSRDSGTVYRIFYLEDKVKGGVASFNELESGIKNELLNEAIAKETDRYLKRLRKHFAVNESLLKDLPEEFQPFNLRQ